MLSVQSTLERVVEKIQQVIEYFVHFITFFPTVSSEQKTAWRIPIISLCLCGCIILNSACNKACAQHSMIIIPDDILAQYSADLKKQPIGFSRYTERSWLD